MKCKDDALVPRAMLCSALALLAVVGPSSAAAQEARPPAGDAGYWPAAAGAQNNQPAAAATPPVGGLPTADEADEKPSGGWLLRSPVADVGWPKISLPEIDWKPFGGSSPDEDGAPGPIARMTQATQSAVQRGRDAWNGAIEKMKIGPFRSRRQDSEDEQPSFFASIFGGGQESQQPDTVAGFIGQDRPQLR